MPSRKKKTSKSAGAKAPRYTILAHMKSADDKELVARAAEKVNRTVSNYVSDVVLRDARRVLEEANVA